MYLLYIHFAQFSRLNSLVCNFLCQLIGKRKSWRRFKRNSQWTRWRLLVLTKQWRTKPTETGDVCIVFFIYRVSGKTICTSTVLHVLFQCFKKMIFYLPDTLPLCFSSTAACKSYCPLTIHDPNSSHFLLEFLATNLFFLCRSENYTYRTAKNETRRMRRRLLWGKS